MGHIAIISKETNLVLSVTPVSNEKMQIDGVDNLDLAKAHLIKCFSTPDFKDGLPYLKENGDKHNLSEVDFVQTSYHENIHYNFAGTGDTWDSENMAFIKPMPATEEILIGGMSNMSSTTGSWQLNNRFKWEWVDNSQLLMRGAQKESVTTTIFNKVFSNTEKTVSLEKQSTMKQVHTFKSVLFGAFENIFFFFALLLASIISTVTIFTYDYGMIWLSVFFTAILILFIRQLKIQAKDLNNGTSR